MRLRWLHRGLVVAAAAVLMLAAASALADEPARSTDPGIYGSSENSTTTVYETSANQIDPQFDGGGEPSPVPEPGSLILFSLGGLMIARCYIKSRKHS